MNLLALLLLLLAVVPVEAQTADPTLPPPNAPVLFTALGTGVQIYICVAGPAPHWNLQAPQAALTDAATGRKLGTHTAGPTWTWTDGSSVHGVVTAKLPSPEPDSIPWLLLLAEPVGDQRHGAMAEVTWIRRSETHGGNPPAAEGCDAAHAGTSVSCAVPRDLHVLWRHFGGEPLTSRSLRVWDSSLHVSGFEVR